MSIIRKTISISFTLALVAGSVVLAVNWQRAVDQMRVWSYEPTAEIVSLASRSGLSDEGNFYFYVAHPKLESVDEFNDKCQQREQSNPILGCYIGGSGVESIHILDIVNQELDGIKEVTAAHEMLHVVYARTTSTEKARLANLLEEAYKRVETDNLRQRMEYYERHEPGSRTNELHSILATEFSGLGPELESYYSKYFTDRQKIVDLHQGYNQKFEALENEREELMAGLEARLKDIESRRDEYEAKVAELNQKIALFNQRAASGYFALEQDFQIAKSQLSGEVLSANQLRDQIRQDVDRYNQDVAKVNELGAKINQMTSSMSSIEGEEL